MDTSDATKRTAGLSSRMRYSLRYHDLLLAPGNAMRVSCLPEVIEFETNNRLDLLSRIITTMAAQAHAIEKTRIENERRSF